MIDANYTIGIYKEAKALGTHKTYSACKYLIEETIKQIEAGTYSIKFPINSYTAEVWSGETDINGIPGATILKDLPAGGYAYLVKRNDAILILQPHDPDEAGFVAMSKERAQKRGDQEALQLASTELLALIRSHLIELCIID